MKQSRRDFLIRTTCAGLSAAAAQASLKKLGLMNLYARPSAPTDYRALVCIFMDGGNDSNNMVVPRDSYYTNQYAIARPQSSGLQLPLGSLLPVNNPPSLGGRAFGFHPGLGDDPVTFYPGLASLYNTGKLDTESLRMLPHFSHYIHNAERSSEEKALFFLHQHFPEKIVKSFPIRAVLLPRVSGQRETTLRRASPAEGLKALAPSTIFAMTGSLFKLTGAAQTALQTMAGLMRRVPCYHLELGTKLEQIPEVIGQLLDGDRDGDQA